MALPKLDKRIPVSIGQIQVVIEDNDGTDPNRFIRFTIVGLDSNGQPVGSKAGDLLPEMTNAQKTSVKAFLDALRAKAIAEAIPT